MRETAGRWGSYGRSEIRQRLDEVYQTPASKLGAASNLDQVASSGSTTLLTRTHSIDDQAGVSGGTGDLPPAHTITPAPWLIPAAAIHRHVSACRGRVRGVRQTDRSVRIDRGSCQTFEASVAYLKIWG